MTECKSHKTYKAVYPPRCSCQLCWYKWFMEHPGLYSALKTTEDYFGIAMVERTMGMTYRKFYQWFRDMGKHE